VTGWAEGKGKRAGGGTGWREVFWAAERENEREKGLG